MKISKLFHWLYFSVMMLPLVVAPIFAVYSHRHQLTDNAEASIQYKYQSNEVTSGDDLVEGNLYHLDITEHTIDEILSPDGELRVTLVNVYDYDFSGYFDDFSLDDRIVDNTNVDSNIYINFYVSSFAGYFETYLGTPESEDYFYTVFIGNLDTAEFTLVADVIYQYCNETYVLDEYFSYSDYNEISHIDFSDTDIMHVFVNNYADAIDNYFNYDRAFNFGVLYTWLNTTFFNSQAPLGFFIFWHLLIYWLLTSILWLVFDVLMYVPQLVHRWLDKASLS